MKLLLPLLCVLAFTSPVAGADPLPRHPRLLFNAEGIEQLKQRVQQEPWTSWWKTFRAGFDKTLDAPVELPPRGGTWAHWYVCPTHGTQLETGKKIGAWQWEHICPTDKKVLLGDPAKPQTDLDGVAIGNAHAAYAEAIRDAGILFQVTRDERYARRGRAILLAYADRYLSYPMHTKRNIGETGGGRLTPQTLNEAMWLIRAAHGADLVWETLSETDRRVLADKLFLPAARDVILVHRMGIHNIQCWKNSAVGLTGYLLGDQELIRAAIDDPHSGFHAQMAEGVQADGVWYEGSWLYHFFTLDALWPLTEAARNCGLNLYGEPLKKMYEAPLNLATPDLVLPAFNDSTAFKIPSSPFELAYARYKNPTYLTALADSKRDDTMALWFAVPELPTSERPVGRSLNAPDSGYAILRRGAGKEATWLCLKYGQHGGDHGHPDKNSFVLYARGKGVCSDPGTRPYGSPLHVEWDKATVAHNTLVVDGTNQAPATGQCLAFGSDNGCDFVMADAGPIAEGVRFVRTAVMLEENLILFADEVVAEKPRTFDLATHLSGTWQSGLPDAAPTLPSKGGYQHLKDATLCRATTTALSQNFSLAPDWRATIVLAGGEPTDVIAATGPGESTEERIPMTIFRRTAARTTFVWAIALDGIAPALEVLAPRDQGGVSIRIGAATASWEISIDTHKRGVHVKPLPRN